MTETKTAEALLPQVECLHAKIDDAIRACIYARAAEISGVPVQVIKDTLIARSSSNYCRCKALRGVIELL